MCAQLGSVESTECLCKRCTYPRMYDHRGYVCINGSGATKPVHIRSYLNHFQHTHTHPPLPEGEFLQRSTRMHGQARSPVRGICQLKVRCLFSGGWRREAEGWE